MVHPRPAELLAVLIACSCSAHGSEPTQVAPEPEVVPAPEPVRVAAPTGAHGADELPRASCRAQAAASRHPLSRALHTTEVAGRTFAVAWRRKGAEVETVIASLDARGELVLTPVPVPPADPLAIGGDPGGLVIVSVAHRGAGTLLRVAVAEDGALRPDRPTPLPGVAWGWPAAITSDGAVATLRHTIATPDQTAGGEVHHAIDLATRRVLATTPAPPGATLHCHAGACTTVEVVREGETGRASLTRRGPGGEARLELTVGSTCPIFYPLASGDALVLVAPGAPWRAAVVDATSLGEAAIDASLSPMPGCGRALVAFPSTTRPGLIDGHRGPRTLLTFDPARRTFGAAESLPEQSFLQWVHATHPDGVIEVAWTGGSGMTHSPTDARGVRRYYEHWYFEGGQVALLRREAGRWAFVDAAPLALADAEGTFHRGYTPLVLRNGLHAAVLLAPEGGGEEAWLQPYLAPCPAFSRG